MIEEFYTHLEASIQKGDFVKLTLSKKGSKQQEVNNIYGRLVSIKNQLHLSLTYRYATKDIVKNFPIPEGIEQLKTLIGTDFLETNLLTQQATYRLAFNKKRKAKLFIQKAENVATSSLSHDKVKQRIVPENRPFLRHLGVTSSNGKVHKHHFDKYRQINKYIEIIDGLLNQMMLPSELYITDMGSGKGYLTFALYDYLVYTKGLKVQLTGIELRPHLVEFCNKVAKDCAFEQLNFLAKDIYDFHPERIDILIALHACDIATDIAIHKGIIAKAKGIICAPCCHKQIRKEMTDSKNLQPMLKHGILLERQAEMITDSIRSLLMEHHGYQSKIFEFISSEHTGKNLMITGVRTNQSNTNALTEIAAIKQQFGIKTHYLETLMDEA